MGQAAARKSGHPENASRFTGTCLLGFEPLFVFEHEGDLVVAFPGVPAPYGARALPEGDHFRLEGGQLEGSELIFLEGDPSPGGTLCNVIEFRRAPGPLTPRKIPGGRGLVAPPLDLSTVEQAAIKSCSMMLAPTPMVDCSNGAFGQSGGLSKG